MARLVEGLEQVVTQLADRVRRERGESITGTVGSDDVEGDLAARQLLRQSDHPDALARWIEILASWRLHRSKLFEVDPRLCTLLGATDMTLPVEALRLPFPAFALVFDDRLTLGLAERALARHDDLSARGRLLRRLTVHASELELPLGQRGLRLAFMLDAGQADEPALLIETLQLEEEATLDSALDALGGGPAMRDLSAFVAGVICYATSRDATVQHRAVPPTPSRPAPAPAAARPFLVADEVLFLPLPIDISNAEVIHLVRQRRVGAAQVVRYMVRGHWRRANENWKDQRPRWIAPHWRGPSAAAILERPYRLRCADAPPADDG
jgi:hypothetical protein